LILVALLTVAQNQEDSLEIEKPKKDLRPYEIKVGTNLSRSLRSLGTSISTHELEAAISFYKYVFVVDYGIQKTIRNETFQYQNEGSFYRMGISSNFVKDQVSGNTIALGLRYARASFQDEMSFISEGFFGTQEVNLSNPNLTARWIELVFDIRGRITSNFVMGFSTRWQFARKINGEDILLTYDIPGFGNTKRQNSTAFDYYLMWRIPLKKK